FLDFRSPGLDFGRVRRLAGVSIGSDQAPRIIRRDRDWTRHTCVGLLADRQTWIRLELDNRDFVRVELTRVVGSPGLKRRSRLGEKIAGRDCVYFRSRRYLCFLFLDQNGAVDLGQSENRDL